MTPAAAVPPAADPALLARLALKRGLRLGLLGDAERDAALALAWACLPSTAVLNEREVNQALQAALGGPLACLDLDHVELRRWLVDGGWLVRDGYGRAYQRVAPAGLRPGPARWAALPELADAAAWVQGLHAAREAERAARRQGWLAGQPATATARSR